MTTIDYSNPDHMGQMMKKISDHCQRYYVDWDGTVLLYYQGTWVPYHEVMVRDRRLAIGTE